MYNAMELCWSFVQAELKNGINLKIGLYTIEYQQLVYESNAKKRFWFVSARCRRTDSTSGRRLNTESAWIPNFMETFKLFTELYFENQ